MPGRSTIYRCDTQDQMCFPSFFALRNVDEHQAIHLSFMNEMGGRTAQKESLG
jgi:hypothetical protein